MTKIYTVTLADIDGNRDPESAWNVVGAFTDLADAQELLHSLLDEALEARDVEFVHTEEEGRHVYRDPDQPDTHFFTLWDIGSGEYFTADDEYLWMCKIEGVELS